MKIIPILMLTLLTGCQTLHVPPTPETQVVSKIEYIIKVPPAELMRLPAKQEKIDVDNPNLKQSDVSRWIEGSESYTMQLENQLTNIAKFFVGEQQKLDDQAKKENSK